MEQGLTKNQIITELTKSPHGNLSAYLPVVSAAVKQEPEFIAHLIAWNQRNGQIRDAKLALPVISMTSPMLDGQLLENSLAALAMQSPRDLARAIRFAKEIKPAGRGKLINNLVEHYLRYLEMDRHKWDRAAVQHRRYLKELYALLHIKPSQRADDVLFKGKKPVGSIFAVIDALRKCPTVEAAGLIVKYKIPFLIAAGAMGVRMREKEVVMALIDNMTATELVTNTKMLERLGIKDDPVLRAAYQNGLKKVVTSKAVTFKTAKAVEAVDDEAIKQKLIGAQEKQLDRLGVDGDWLILADKSGSMQNAIAASRQIAGVLARLVTGKVCLVFFDNTVSKVVDVSGKDLHWIENETEFVQANGGTALGVGLDWATQKGLNIDGVAIVSDGADHRYPFSTAYKAYVKKFDKQPTVYFYKLSGELDTLTNEMKMAKIQMETFDLRGGFDYYSLPNIVATMNTNRYSMVDRIMDTPLLKLENVFKGEVHV